MLLEQERVELMIPANKVISGDISNQLYDQSGCHYKKTLKHYFVKNCSNNKPNGNINKVNIASLYLSYTNKQYTSRLTLFCDVT